MLRLQPYKQNSLCREQSPKLAHWFYGPFQVVKTIGTIAYELQLPSTAHIHPIFHISNSMLSREHHLLPFQIWQLIYWALTLIYALLNYWALWHYKLLKDFKIKSSFNGRILLSWKKLGKTKRRSILFSIIWLWGQGHSRRGVKLYD